VRNRAAPESPLTTEETRYITAVERDRQNLLALVGGVPVGAAFCGPLPLVPDSSTGEAGIRIVPEARGQDVREALFAACASRLRELGKDAMRIAVREGDDEAWRYLESRGFSEIGRSQEVVLDLDTLPEHAGPPPAGVSIVSLADRPDLMHGAWEVDVEATPDIPGPDGDEPLSWEFFQEFMSKPGLDHRLLLVAVAGDDEVVGLALLSRNVADPSLAVNWMTGVRRAWRRRGIAAALKEHQLVAARALGVRRVRTQNELRNEPIRRLNERLGYRRAPDHILLHGPL
jgi:GNAT superfamily N-acetyltransferase